MFEMSFESKLVPTSEQREIISLAKTGKNLSILAFAGAAKTTTLEMIADEIHHSSLYIAFNATIANEARKKFPSHVECRTGHSLAYEAIVKGSSFAKRGKIAGYYDYNEIGEILTPFTKYLPKEDKFAFCLKVVEIIKDFCNSDLKEINLKKLELFQDSSELELEILTQAGIYLWNEYINPKSKYKITHDVYFKLWHLSEPDLSKYKTIYIDEFQDTNPVLLDIILKQNNSQLIVVGDNFQSIYGWRGAVNAFENLPKSWNNAVLTESFRFPQEIADYANNLIIPLGAKNEVKGRGKGVSNETQAILCRTNFTIFNHMLDLTLQEKTFETSIDTGDLFSALYTASTLRFTRKDSIPDFGKWPHKQISTYKSYKELIEDQNPEIKKIVQLLDLCISNGGVHQVITRIKQFLITPKMKEENPDFDGEIFLSTGHKAKGLEFDIVTISDDFLPYYNDEEDPDETFKNWIKSQNANLLYVALTRAKSKLILSDEMLFFIRNFSYRMELINEL